MASQCFAAFYRINVTMKHLSVDKHGPKGPKTFHEGASLSADKRFIKCSGSCLSADKRFINCKGSRLSADKCFINCVLGRQPPTPQMHTTACSFRRNSRKFSIKFGHFWVPEKLRSKEVPLFFKGGGGGAAVDTPPPPSPPL